MSSGTKTSNGRHLRVLDQAEVDDETIDLKVETTQSEVRIALAARTRVLRDEAVVPVGRTLVEEPGFVAHQLMVPLEHGHPTTVEKIVAIFSSRDRAIAESRHEARLAVAAAGDFAELLTRHAATWDTAWNRYGIEMDSANEWTQRVLHLHIFHLVQTVPLHTTHLDVGVPARGWNGEAYRGHIFWDELFIFPILNFQRPFVAASLLQYRHARLGAARWAARAAGLRRSDVPLAERLGRA